MTEKRISGLEGPGAVPRAPWPHWPLVLVAGLSGLYLAMLWRFPRWPQQDVYHGFADARPWLGIPNFADFASNAPLFLVGFWGLVALWRHRRPAVDLSTGPPNGRIFADVWEARFALGFFLAVALTGLGSAWYHWAPDTPRLFWDRLPLSAISMCLPPVMFAGASSSSVTRLQVALLVLWVAAAPASVLHWHLSESFGQGDLRGYAATQIASLAATLAFVHLLPRRPGELPFYLAALVLYVLSRVTERHDALIFSWGGILSGHTLKHLLSALLVAVLLRMVLRRGKRTLQSARDQP